MRYRMARLGIQITDQGLKLGENALTPSKMPTEPSAWQDGWLMGIRHLPSPNFATTSPPHQHGGDSLHQPAPGQYGGNEVEQLFLNQLDWSAHPYFAEQIRGAEVSAHFSFDVMAR